MTGPTLRHLERAGVALLLLAALVPRVRGFGDPFDRELEGFQGSCFASFAVNYGRLGILRFGGYPVFGADLPRDLDAGAWVYANHPPTVPLLCWATLEAIGPDGWDDAWREDRPPEGVEGPLRLPFLAFHVLGLLAFWWALRQACGRRQAMLGLAILAMLPISAVYAKLVNYESPSLALVLLAFGFHARWLRSGARRDLALTGLSFALAGTITFAPLFFVPPLVLQTLARRRWRAALVEGATIGLAGLLPLLGHGLWVRLALPGANSEPVWTRAAHLLAPLFDGSAPLPEWLQRQWIRMDYYFSTPILWAACAGLVLALVGAWRERGRTETVPLGPPLALGGLLLLFGFYRHTFDGEGVHDGQTLFLLNLAPACAALVAVLLDALAPALARLRGGIAPLVVATSLIGLPGVARTNRIHHAWRAPGPRDDPALEQGPPAPLPRTVGDEIRAILPPGSIGLYPSALGLTTAASYYAWRTLMPVDRATFGQAIGRLEAMGLGDRPRYLLLPTRPSEEVARQMEEVHTDLVGRGEPEVTSEHWELWPLR